MALKEYANDLDLYKAIVDAVYAYPQGSPGRKGEYIAGLSYDNNGVDGLRKRAVELAREMACSQEAADPFLLSLGLIEDEPEYGLVMLVAKVPKRDAASSGMILRRLIQDQDYVRQAEWVNLHAYDEVTATSDGRFSVGSKGKDSVHYFGRDLRAGTRTQ